MPTLAPLGNRGQTLPPAGAFQSFKMVLVEHTDLAMDALTIYVTQGVFFGSCLLFGWKARTRRP